MHLSSKLWRTAASQGWRTAASQGWRTAASQGWRTAALALLLAALALLLAVLTPPAHAQAVYVPSKTSDITDTASGKRLDALLSAKADDPGAIVSAAKNGLVGDAIVSFTGSVTSGSNVLTDPNASFTAALVGKTIYIGAGAGGSGNDIMTPVQSVTDATHLVLTTGVNAQLTTAAAPYVVGTDNTAALAAAVSAAQAKGSAIVQVPSGRFLFAGHVSVPNDITLQGVNQTWSYPGAVAGNGTPGPLDGGTTFLPMERTGGATGTPFITYLSNFTIRGICFYQPFQLTTLTTPLAYPWVISAGNGARNLTVEDVQLALTYLGVTANNSGNPERVNVRRLAGQPLYCGLQLDQIYDICHVDNCHFNPYLAGTSTNLFAWQLANGVAYDIGKADWTVGSGDFAYGYYIDFKFGCVGSTPSNATATSAYPATGSWVNCAADRCHFAAYIGQVDPAIGLSLVNWKFGAQSGTNPVDVQFADVTTGGSVHVANCNFGNCTRDRCVVIGAGNPTVFFTDNYIYNWNSADQAILTYSGQLICRGNYFRQNGTQSQNLTGTQRAIYTGNMTAPGYTFTVSNAASLAAANFVNVNNL